MKKIFYLSLSLSLLSMVLVACNKNNPRSTEPIKESTSENLTGQPSHDPCIYDLSFSLKENDVEVETYEGGFLCQKDKTYQLEVITDQCNVPLAPHFSKYFLQISFDEELLNVEYVECELLPGHSENLHCSFKAFYKLTITNSERLVNDFVATAEFSNVARRYSDNTIIHTFNKTLNVKIRD